MCRRFIYIFKPCLEPSTSAASADVPETPRGQLLSLCRESSPLLHFMCIDVIIMCMFGCFNVHAWVAAADRR